MSTIHIPTVREYDAFAAAIIEGARSSQSSHGATVITLSGELGAGKTTFVQAIARSLGVHEVVQSPTFGIYKIYATNDQSFKRLVHMDAYRIESLEELGPLRFAELLHTPETLVCIEWAERIEAALPEKIIELVFEEPGGSGEGRQVTISGVELP